VKHLKAVLCLLIGVSKNDPNGLKTHISHGKLQPGND